MEIVIVICLLVVIALLLHDKISIKKPLQKSPKILLDREELPDIMGLPKLVERHAVPSTATESQKEKQQAGTDNFDSESTTGDFAKDIPQEEPDEVFGEVVPDFDEEEEEWAGYGEPNGENGFATGVTFEELSTVGMLLGQDEPEPSLQKQAVEIVQKLQGTELFSLLENSIENAAQKIAKLLDGNVPAGLDSGSSTMRDTNLNDFDIGNFV